MPDEQNPPPLPNRGTYLGLAVVTLVTLMYEILLTRIFSITMWYHFAFMAISVAMFGMTASALTVYCLPRRFDRASVHGQLALFSGLFAISMLACAAIHAAIPAITAGWDSSWAWIFSIFATYPLMIVPYFFSGLVVALALTRFPGQVSKLYFTDLAGAAAGCVLIIALLALTDGLSALLFLSALAAAACCLFAWRSPGRALRQAGLACFVALLALGAWHSWQAAQGRPIMRLEYEKGKHSPRPLYEKWNSFSRVTIFGEPDKWQRPLGWGISSTYPPSQLVRYLNLRIDGCAGSVLTRNTGLPSETMHLFYDITNLAHYLRNDASVLVIGVGGGRDILSALTYKQKAVTGVEINGSIIEAITGPFGDYTGHLERAPGVRIINDEARSFVSRSEEKFDIIQVSLIDTWAATAAGGLALTENSLYTTEAWQMFIRHLKPGGILTFSRWYHRPVPTEVYRLSTLAAAALRAAGVADPRKHMIIASFIPDRADRPGVATMLVSSQPFSSEDLQKIEIVCQELKFNLEMTPTHCRDPLLAALAAPGSRQIMAALPVNVEAPSDDCPYFFQTVRLSRETIFGSAALFGNNEWFNNHAVVVLIWLLAFVCLLATLTMVLPLIFIRREGPPKLALPMICYFFSIGMGFMLIEIAQLQRLSTFLGHPTYSLAVLLFSLLLSGGLGSLTTSRVMFASESKDRAARLVATAFVAALCGLATRFVVAECASTPMAGRIALSIVLVAPMGLFMGMCFPLGMRLAARTCPESTPWFWGINGAASVVASVLAIVIALTAGIHAAFFTGVAFYVLATLSAIWAARSGKPD